MHSSRMRTARSNSRQLGGAGSASVYAGIHPPGVGLETPLGVGMETPRCGPGDPLGVGLKTPTRPDSSTSPHGCGPGNLQGMLGCTPTGVLQGMLGYHHLPPPMDRQTCVKT